MKAAFASSLAYHPKLIVLDEPFGGLDPLVRDELIEGMLERATEATIFISSLTYDAENRVVTSASARSGWAGKTGLATFWGNLPE